MLAPIRNTRINLPSPRLTRLVYSPPGLIGLWLILCVHGKCSNLLPFRGSFFYANMNFDAINPVSFKNVKKRRMALFFFEINKEYRCLTSFEKLGEAICKQEEEEEILYFFPPPPLIFLGNLFAELGLSSRVILIRSLVSRVIAFYGPCWRSYANRR